MFKRFQMLKKGVETIKKVAPSVGNKLGKKKVDLLKKMGKTQRTNPENFKKAGGDKLKKEILGAETRVKKAIGGMLGFKKKDKKKEKEKKDSEKGTKPKDLIYKPNKMKRLEELRKELKAKGGAVGKKGKKLGRGLAGAARKEKRLNMPLEKVYGQVADRSRKRLKKRGNIKIEDLIDKGKEDITEAGKAMGGYKSGGRAFGGGKR